MQMDGIIARGQLVKLVFAQDNVAASQTDVQLNIQEVASAAALAITGYTMPFKGCIVAIAYDLSAAGTAGVFTVGPTVGGTEKTTLTKTVGTTTQGRGVVARDSIPFAAGDVIGAEITTDGSWDGTTSDLAVTVWVLLDIEGI